MRLRVCWPALWLVPSLCLAQSFTPVRELKNLSSGAIEKLHTLDTLNALPAGEWRFHTGDLPHGESAVMDDSAWSAVKLPTDGTNPVTVPQDAAWYRRTIEVPKTLNGYDITGMSISFQFRAHANGPVPQIVYFNGRRVAMGEDLEAVPLFASARPGDRVLVAVKLLRTVDKKTIDAVKLQIAPAETGLSSGRPLPDDVRTECITAANMLPALTPARRDLLPRVEEAIAAIDTRALAAADQRAFDASLRKARGILAELHPVLAQAKIDLAGNSHIDAAWLWPRSETIDVVRRTFTTALQLMNEYPGYTYTQSAAQYSAWMADKYPDINAQIKQRVQEGRWEIVGGMWVEPDLNMPGGESLVRQLLVGQRVFHDLYGVTARIGWNPDSFGYNWQLPQVYKRSGLDYFVTQKMHWNDTNQLPFRLFWWQSPDGSKVLTYFPTDYAWTNVNPTRLSADFAESAQRNPGTTEHLDLFGVGDHGGGPTRAMLDQADKWIAASHSPKSGVEEGFSPPSMKLGTGALAPGFPAAVPTFRYGTAQQYFTNVVGHLNPDSPVWNYDHIAKGYTPPPMGANGALGLPTWNDELYFEYHRGVFTSQAKHKANMRRSETATLNAEKLASFAWLFGNKYPAPELTENWKKITFNQFHDLAAGSGIAVIYRDAQKDYTEVFHSDALISEGARNLITANIDTSKRPDSFAVPIVVFNSLPWERVESADIGVQLPASAPLTDVTDEAGAHLAFQIIQQDKTTHSYRIHALVPKVPSLGYTVMYVSSANRDRYSHQIVSMENSVGSYKLSNASVSIEIDKSTGCVTALRTSNTSYLAPNACGNQLQAFADNPKNYDAWNVDPGTLDKQPTTIDKVDSIKLVEDGPLRKTVRIERSWSKSHFTQAISLNAYADFVRIDNDIDWHESHVLLKAAFPLAASGPKATYEIPFGSIERPTTRDNSWEKAKFEVPALRWADLGDDKQGVSILNDSKYGYDALGNTLRLTLLRSPTWPDPDADRGHQHFTYAIYPHTGTWKQAETVRRAYELNTPLVAEQVFAHTGTLPPTYSFASVENRNVTLTAVKKAEDSDALVFRMYEWAGQGGNVKLHVPPGASYAVESNLMEKPEGPHLPLSGDVVTVPIKPYEILTVQVAYPHKAPPSKK